MKNTIYKLCFFVAVFITASVTTIYAQKSLSEARIYINPGHGGWGPNDRNMATINYPQSTYAEGDTLCFFETSTNLVKALSLYDELLTAGAKKENLTLSRNRNGVKSPSTSSVTVNDKIDQGDVIEGVTQLVDLSVISAYVEENNFDYFLSIHSNAATEGSQTNYPLLLYRGTDAEVGNGLKDAKKMGLDAWKHIIDNGVTYYSHYTLPTQNNVRGDVSFMGSGSTGALGYYGYYGVLKHGSDGFLSEGCFHTYQPERHRLMNDDYCRQEGVRYARAIRAWFGDTSSKTTGDIMGTVKDKYRKLEHSLYKYANKSVDAHLPINEVTVVLKNAEGNEVAQYKTDHQYNGLYSFTNLEPGTYTLVFDFPETEYIAETIEVEVTANKTTFINQLVTDMIAPPPYLFKDPYYPTPEQDGDIAAPQFFGLEKEMELLDIDVLKDLTIRRVILRDNKYYVLAVDAAKAPKLLVLNPTTGEVIKEMSTEGIVTEGYNGKEYPFVLSDISFTTDGVLIGTNSTVVGRENNGFQTGDFYVYKWEATETVNLEDAPVQVLAKLKTNTSESILAAGNNYSNFMANSIAVKGNSNCFYLYFDSHAGNDWTSNYRMRFVSWLIEDGNVTSTQWTDSPYYAPIFGASHRLTYSPFGDIKDESQHPELHRFVLDGNISQPIEFRLSETVNSTDEIAKFTSDIPKESSGINFFRYLDKVYMTTAIATPGTAAVDPQMFGYRINLYDVTEGLNNAIAVGETEIVLDAPLTYMSTAGVVRNEAIDVYLFVGNNIIKFKTKDIPANKIARIFASELKSVETKNGYEITYVLNENATEVELIFTNSETGKDEKTISLSGLTKGKNTVNILWADIPNTESNANYNWSIKAKADNITKFVKLSDDSEKYQFVGPRGVAVDKTPESKYFGRVYITNSGTGSNAGRTTSQGIYILGADGSDITNQSSNAHTGGITWNTSDAGLSPRKVAVAADGRVFISDYSKNNSGIYFMNPESFEMTSLFPDATRETTYGNLSIGDKFVVGRTPAIGVRGVGADTQIFAVDASSEGANAGWKKYVSMYNIGESTVLNKAPDALFRKNSYVANENSSVVPVEGGFWAAQFRGAGSNSVANPCMYYHSDKAGEPVFNTAEDIILTKSSENGALAVNEQEGLLALSYDGGVTVFSYIMDGEGIPTVTEKFSSKLQSSGVTYDDFAFDFAGNLYAVSYSGKLVSVWAMPTSDNSSIVPAQKSMLIHAGIGTSVEKVEALQISVYPNPVNDLCVIKSDNVISNIDVYTNTGVLVDRINNNNTSSVTLNTSRYSKGVYMIKVNNEKTVKIIKQ